jgi:hypothetical protein
MSTRFYHRDRIFSSTDTITSTTTAPASATRKKSSSKKTIKKTNVGNSYEHHLEKWLENTSKMNFDYNNGGGGSDGNNWPFMNAPNAFQQPTNRKGFNHLQNYGSSDPISLPSHIVSLIYDSIHSCRMIFFIKKLF